MSASRIAAPARGRRIDQHHFTLRNSIMLSRSSLWICGTAVALGACSRKPAPPAAQTAPTVVTITATDYTFGAPDTVPAGLVTMHLVDAGMEPHQVVVMRLDSGKTMADLSTMMSNPDAPIPAWLSFPIGVSVIAPGDTGNATALLTPGLYAMACFVSSADGAPHVAKGMVRPFIVAASAATPAPEPTADITITEKDYEFVISAPITAGTHTIRVENAGPQVHEVAISMLAPGKSVADLQAYITGGMKGAPPGKPIGGVTGPDPGGHQTFTATFTPGNYVIICLVPDKTDAKPHVAHGMLKEFKVS